ncbi:PQQ-binding-like beta-propeller repeat protein [Bacteroides sp.]|uniref:outer membrane protein assembly factor BamB family protein n=1 Tax=Bacteroides sp. TaxID=29523 RepID=UPI001B405AE1|nr:PQQ-binding-like beta-propeller repeat protein [Bacteroides sp.]MBP6936285.1 PQQ-binding-like beta-propeller repeat protein [Bacteroides sp.]
MNRKLNSCIVGILLACTTLHAQVGERFRFALLTDLHITSKTTATEDLERAVKQLNATPDIDFVVVAGDVTEEGDRASLLRTKEILDQLHIKYYIAPGNHETKWSESGVTDFGHIFGGERFEFEHKGFLFLGFNTGPLMRMADGHVAPQDITWMKERLAKVGKKKPVFLVTHYPLQKGDVDNWYEVTDAVRTYNIRAFLGGHYHSNRALSYDGIPGILNRSVLRAKELTGGYSVYTVTPDSLLVSEQKIGKEPQQWTSLSLTKTYYTLQGATDKYPDFSVNQIYPQVKEHWLVKTGIGIYGSPAVYNEQVFVADDMGFLTAYRLKDGKKQWSFRSGNRIVGTPAVADNRVVFGSTDKHIYGLDAKSGKQCWRIETTEPVLGAVSIENGVAYVGASDHTFRAIRIKDGKLLWSYTGVKGYIETLPLIVDNKVVFGAWDNTLYALDKKNGQELWKWTGGLTRMHFSPAAVWPVAAHGKVFITDPERALTAIDLEKGTTVWRTYQSKVRETIGLSEDKERLYSKTMGDSVVCFATRGNTPQQLWASDVGFGYEHAPSMQIEKEGIVYGSTKGGLIFALDALSGRVLWKHKVGNSLINTVVPLSRHRVLFSATGGETGLLEWNEKQKNNL